MDFCRVFSGRNATLLLDLLQVALMVSVSIELFQVRSRRPYCCFKTKKQRPYYYGNWTLFLCRHRLLFQWINIAASHVSENALCIAYKKSWRPRGIYLSVRDSERRAKKSTSSHASSLSRGLMRTERATWRRKLVCSFTLGNNLAIFAVGREHIFRADFRR